MPRISYVDPKDVSDPELSSYLEDAIRFGTPRLESQSIRAHVPDVLRTFSQSWDRVFRHGILDNTVKELARVFVAQSIDCGYCAGQRSHVAAKEGLTETRYDGLLEFRESDRYSAREKAALRWAEAIAWDPGLADDALWEELHAHFSEPELVELGHFIALTMGQQRFLKTLAIEHGDMATDSVGLAPEVAARLAASSTPSD